MTKHDALSKWRVMSIIVNPTKEIFSDMIEAGICESFEYPENVDDYKSLELIDNLVLPKLDAYAKWIQEKLDNTTIEESEVLANNFMYVAQLTNKWLKAVNADEIEMYAIDD